MSKPNGVSNAKLTENTTLKCKGSAAIFVWGMIFGQQFYCILLIGGSAPLSENG